MAEGKCDTKDCLSEPAVRVHWPGQSRSMCRPCALRAAGVAAAMGFVLTVEELAQ